MGCVVGPQNRPAFYEDDIMEWILMEKYPQRDYTTKALYAPKGSVVIKSLFYPATI